MSYVSQAIITLTIILGLYLIFKLKYNIPTINSRLEIFRTVGYNGKTYDTIRISLVFLIIFIIIVIGYPINKDKDTFKPINAQHVLIYYYGEGDSNSCYIINNKSEINKLRKLLNNMNLTDIYEYPWVGDLTVIKDDTIVEGYQITSGYPKKSTNIINKYTASKYERKFYWFRVPKKIKYEDIASNIKEFNKDLIVYSGTKSHYSYIEATYKDNYNNYNNIDSDDVYNEYSLGEFEPDNVFIPLKEYLEKNKLLNSYSKVVGYHGSYGSYGFFERRIKFYLNEDIDEKELNKLSSTFKDDFNNYEEPITYVQIDNYDICVISKQEIKDIESFTERFNIKLGISNR